MYGNSGKLGGRGRGNGGGGTGGGGGRGSAVKRNRSPFPQPSSLLPHRTVVGPSSNRLSTTGGGAASSRNRNEIANPSSINTHDETFNLVSDDPLSYAMIIRLTPDLVDEIRRVESQGGNAQIKFDSNANNSSGNVIDVGGKDFRFTWSHEPGDLCDIYEERRSGEDGKGLLVESGCPWRKLNVQRILDESTKNHVKMRSEEAEQKSKSRKAIILDHANPSIKNQLKTAVDFNQRRTPFSSKREPAFKKQKVESTQVFAGGPPKSIFKPGFSSTPSTKGRLPVPSPPEQTITSTSPFGSGNHRMVPAGVDYPQAPNKDNTANSGKETPSRTVHAFGYDLSGSKMGSGATSKNLQRMLITLLQEHPKGMSLEALERSVGDTIPNCAKKIDPILNKIATSQVPGWYYLKPGVELESFKKPSSGSESSPELGHEQTPRQGSNLVEKAATGEFQPLVQSKLEESSPNENIDILQNSPDILGDKKALDNSEGHASSSSSGSDSDSESDSSDSESDSGSPRSPSAARSGSSSDSESEGSSSNEEGSDVDVDIMIGDDEKEPENKLQTTTSSSVPWKTIDDDPTQNGIDKPEHLVSDTAKVAEDSPDDDIEIDIVDDFDAVPYVANMRSFPDDLNKPRDSEQVPSVSNIGNGNQITKDHGSEMPNSPNKMSKPKPKRSSELNYDDEKSEDAKRLKAGILSQQPTFVRGKDAFPSEDPLHLSHDKLNQDPKKVHNVNMSSKDSKDECADTTLPKGYNLAMAGKSIPDVQQSVQRSGDVGTRRKTFNTERPIKYVDNFARGVELYERSPSLPDRSDGSALRSINAQEKVSMSRGRHKETNDEDGGSFQQSVGKIQNERDIRDKQFMLSDSHSHFRRHGEQVGKLKDVTNSQTGSFSEKDNDNTTPGKSPVGNRKGKMLRREVSELELGELREPISAVDPQAVKKKFDRSNSVKKSKSKSSASDNSDSVMRVSKGRTSAEKIEEPRKHSPPNSRVGSDINQQNLLQKRTPIDDNEDSWTRPQRVGLSQAQQMPLVDSADFEARSQLNKSADMGSKSKKNGYGDTPKKAPISLPQQHDTRHAEQNISQITVREPIPQNTIAITSSNGRVKESLLENSNNSRTRRESSSEEDDASYYKYEKDEPEFKGIINDYPQYKEYVQEYCDKYEVYLSIDKQLEVYRTRFGKLGRDLELAKGRDVQRYNTLVEELKEAYRQCGTRNDWLKKIFVVLHHELKNLKQKIKDFAYEYAKD